MGYGDYTNAIELAGATVLAAVDDEDYQGTFWLRVEYQGDEFWITGSYGSCSGCDAYEATFDSQSACAEHRWDPKVETCEGCRVAANERDTKLAEFGRGYLDKRYAQDEAMEAAATDWDESERKRFTEFIASHPVGSGVSA